MSWTLARADGALPLAGAPPAVRSSGAGGGSHADPDPSQPLNGVAEKQQLEVPHMVSGLLLQFPVRSLEKERCPQ